MRGNHKYDAFLSQRPVNKAWVDTPARNKDNFWNLSRVFPGTQHGARLSCGPIGHCLPYDDGTLVQIFDKRSGGLTPVLLPKAKLPAKPERTEAPESLGVMDREATKFKLKIKNTGEGPLYWVNVTQKSGKTERPPSFFHPPITKSIIKPIGEITVFPAKGF